MNLKSCLDKRLVKRVSKDNELIKSLSESSFAKYKAMKMIKIGDNTGPAKISLMYDAAREYMEAIVLNNGFKVYNHECYCAVFCEALNESPLADEFDEYRKLRNDINYYGRKISKDEAMKVIKNMKDFLTKLKLKFRMLQKTTKNIYIT